MIKSINNFNAVQQRSSTLAAHGAFASLTAVLADQLRALTGYSPEALQAQIDKDTDFEAFFAEAPALNPQRALIKGVVCGVRIENIEDPLMREIRYLDKMIDELAKGKAMEKILRSAL